jgi:hypothetical protein
MLQYYSALPFNIISGATTVQGTTARPMMNGMFINRNAGTGFDYLNINADWNVLFKPRNMFEWKRPLKL